MNPMPTQEGAFLMLADNVLAHLQVVAPLAAWLVARHDEDGNSVIESVVAHKPPPTFEEVQPGLTLPWAETIYGRMISDGEPEVAPVLSAVPSYARTEMARRFEVAAYVGVPITLPDARLHGSVCALDPRSQPP